MIVFQIFVCSCERDFAHLLVETVIIFNASFVRSQRTFCYHNVHETMGTYPICFEDEKKTPLFLYTLYSYFFLFFLPNSCFQKEEKMK